MASTRCQVKTFLLLGTFKQGASKPGVMTFAWRPGSQHDVSPTRGADSVLARDCRAQFGLTSTRRGCRICVTVRLPVRPRGETMYWQANANTPLSVTPLLNVPYSQHQAGQRSFRRSRPPFYLGRDMGGCKTHGGRKMYQRRRSPEKFWTPSKRASGLLCRGCSYRKNRALTPEGGGERTVRGGWVQNPFLGGVSSNPNTNDFL